MVFRFFPVLLALWLALPARAEVQFIGSYHWQDAHPRFGGFSAIEITDDGAGFLVLSDRGFFMTGTFTRTDGQITGVTAQGPHHLRGPRRRALVRAEQDSEGLAIAPDGTIWVSFEWRHGLRSFASVTSAGSDLISSPLFDDLQDNASLEALAIGPDGALYTIPERSGRAGAPFPVYRYQDGIWDLPFTLPRRGAFLVVGADIGPDGRLYVLERDFVGIGFRSRVRRFDLQGGGEQIVLQTGTRHHDNLEGISVWADAIGLRMTLISDDNQNALQQTQIVEYRLTD